MNKPKYSDIEKIQFYRNKIRSLEAKIASEHAEGRGPEHEYPPERLYKKLDELTDQLVKLLNRFPPGKYE